MLSIRSLFNKKNKPKDPVTYINIGETDSTSNYLQREGSDKQNGIVVVYSDFQTAGRGQGSNKWESERGKNLLFSILCHPVWVPVRSQFIISEAIAIALHDALAAYTDEITIKWPNDIYWKDRKISGTIIDNSLQSGHISNCIIGTGVNVNQEQFHSDAPNPVSLIQIIGKETDRMTLLKDIVTRFKGYLDDIRNGNYEKIVSLYMSYLYRSHGFFKYKDKDGVFEAAIIEVEDDGHLILRDKDDQIRSYAFKEVEFVI